ncbi:hypothetical protein AAG570_010519 [Ranatra chinensis]|uniref:Uncharacterized protein n=1 Tax=Ranatra chinensis TaxID=642074 RepID=A0ABD0YYS8_9HEMI
MSKTLRTILDAPWYVSNHTLHTDLNIPTVRQVLHEKFKTFHSKLETHHNPRVSSLSSSTHPLNPPRRLKRRWPRDLLVEYYPFFSALPIRGYHQWVASLNKLFTSL